ncbi:uncharacterized protein PgNI_03325, partial [Pyricularia grisea]|uniref:Uncharacterized protein n=1 Tax=Pyricularia grisea TaxID=148305 RepID=A0A6P8BDX1_PYRGI
VQYLHTVLTDNTSARFGQPFPKPQIKFALCQSFKWVSQPHEARTCADNPDRLLLTIRGVGVCCIATLFVWRGGGDAITQSLKSGADKQYQA